MRLSPLLSSWAIFSVGLRQATAAPSLSERDLVGLDSLYTALWKSLVSSAGYSNSNYCTASGGYSSVTSSGCVSLITKLGSLSSALISRLKTNGLSDSNAKKKAATFFYSFLYGTDKATALTYYNSADKAAAKWQFCFQASAALRTDFDIALSTYCDRSGPKNQTLFLEIADVIDTYGDSLSGFPKLFPSIFSSTSCFQQLFLCCRSSESLCSASNKTTIYDVYSSIQSIEVPQNISSVISSATLSRRDLIWTGYANENKELVTREDGIKRRGISISLSGKYLEYGVAAYNLYKDLKSLFEYIEANWDNIYNLYVKLIKFGSTAVTKFKAALEKIAKTAAIVFNNIPTYISAIKSLFVAIVMGVEGISDSLLEMQLAMSGSYSSKSWDSDVCDAVILKTMKLMKISSPCTQSLMYSMNTVYSASWVGSGYLDQSYTAVSSAACSSYLSMCCAMKNSCGITS